MSETSLGDTGYLIEVKWIERTDDWPPITERWDGQYYYEVFDREENKVGEAAFCAAENIDHVVPCDFFDLAIEIDEGHRRQGIGTALVNDIQKRTGKTLKRRRADSTKAGNQLMEKLGIPYQPSPNPNKGYEHRLQ